MSENLQIVFEPIMGAHDSAFDHVTVRDATGEVIKMYSERELRDMILERYRRETGK